MKLNKFAYLYSKPLGDHTLKIMRKKTWKFTKKPEKSWKYREICQSEKVGTLSLLLDVFQLIETVCTISRNFTIDVNEYF